MTLAEVADAAYVLLLDEVVARSLVDYQVSAAAVMAGMKDKSGKPVTVSNPDEERRLFHDRLRQPFDYERRKAAVLREVAG